MYNLSNRTLTITGTGAMSNYSVETIPWRAYREITRVIIGNSVTTIGNYAFSSCPLTEVTSLACTPPVTGVNIFQHVDISACTLKVPGVSLEPYQAADTWEDFGTIEALAPVGNYSAVICYGSSYTDANFTEPIDAAGVYYAALANSAGCDSIVRLNLTLSPHGVTGSL
ncbi:MAG: leucine-rich repeat domain-containing protein, partial [Bacteroidales bacterium]|nr:leucine-rich repeat domain-containing protein [Bacteroidales bacterium]